jgi:hypothetical protein
MARVGPLRHGGKVISRAEVMNEWSYLPLPPLRLRGVDRENIIFSLFTTEYYNLNILFLRAKLHKIKEICSPVSQRSLKNVLRVCLYAKP